MDLRSRGSSSQPGQGEWHFPEESVVSVHLQVLAWSFPAHVAEQSLGWLSGVLGLTPVTSSTPELEMTQFVFCPCLEWIFWGGIDKMEQIPDVLSSFAVHKGHSELHFPRCASSEPSAPAQALQSGGLERGAGAGALSNCSSSLFRPRWSQLFCLTKQNGAVALSFLLSWASG